MSIFKNCWKQLITLNIKTHFFLPNFSEMPHKRLNSVSRTHWQPKLFHVLFSQKEKVFKINLVLLKLLCIIHQLKTFKNHWQVKYLFFFFWFFRRLGLWLALSGFCRFTRKVDLSMGDWSFFRRFKEKNSGFKSFASFNLDVDVCRGVLFIFKVFLISNRRVSVYLRSWALEECVSFTYNICKRFIWLLKVFGYRFGASMQSITRHFLRDFGTTYVLL